MSHPHAATRTPGDGLEIYCPRIIPVYVPIALPYHMHAIGKIRNMMVLRAAPSAFVDTAKAMYALAIIAEITLAIIVVCSNVCDEGQNPVGGVLYLQRLVGIRMFSLLFSKTNQNRPFEPPPFSDLPAATCATNAVPDTLSGRHAARSRAAVAASNRPISILFQRLRCGLVTRRGEP
jgi:hypothetical protein